MRPLAITVLTLTMLASPALAQQNTPAAAPAGETNPQSGASTTMKPAGGVTNTGSAEMNATSSQPGKTECQSASAEMTNGAVQSCK